MKPIKIKTKECPLFVYNPKDDFVISKRLASTGMYDNIIKKTLLKHIKNNTVFIDIGANIGCYSIPIATHIKNGRIVSIEPFIKNFSLLVQNATINNLYNVDLINAAIGDKDGMVNLFHGVAGNMGDLRVFGNKNNKICAVRTYKLDTLCAFLGINTPNLIKIDVQGNEVAVLKGATNILPSKPVIIMEWSPQLIIAKKDNINDFYDIINTFKYIIKDVRTNKQYTIDNLRKVTSKLLETNTYAKVDLELSGE